MRLGRNKRKLGYFIRYQLYDNDVNYHDVHKFLCLTEFSPKFLQILSLLIDIFLTYFT